MADRIYLTVAGTAVGVLCLVAGTSCGEDGDTIIREGCTGDLVDDDKPALTTVWENHNGQAQAAERTVSDTETTVSIDLSTENNDVAHEDGRGAGPDASVLWRPSNLLGGDALVTITSTSAVLITARVAELSFIESDEAKTCPASEFNTQVVEAAAGETVQINGTLQAGEVGLFTVDGLTAGDAGTVEVRFKPSTGGCVAIADLVFPDANLQRCVDDAVTTWGYSCANEVNDLACIEYGIVNLTGTANFPNLMFLEFWGNSIVDTWPLDGLTKLQTLYLQENQIEHVLGLANLTALTELDLHINNISKVEALPSLVNLEILDLDSNAITGSVAALDTLQKAESIYLNDNVGMSCAGLTHLLNTLGSPPVFPDNASDGGTCTDP